jgi:alpha-L-fucosidase 2
MNEANPSVYNVIWTTPSQHSVDSMPLGNGDIGLNVWIEQNGDMLIYISKTDAWDGNGRLLKLGRLRLHCTPNPYTNGMPFRQELCLESGEIVVNAESLEIRVWADANRPVVNIEYTAPDVFVLEARLESWRISSHELKPIEDHLPIGLLSANEATVVEADEFLECPAWGVVWCHRNERSVWERTLQHQGLSALIPHQHDPLLHRTFGAVMHGEGLRTVDRFTLKSPEARHQFLLRVHALTAQTNSTEVWRRELQTQAAATEAVLIETARHEHSAWWRSFWDRSYIQVHGALEAEAVSRCYALQRFMSACAGRGAYPIMFNGSLFNVDGQRAQTNQPDNGAIPETFDADYRRWGGCYDVQNGRHSYWPMIMAGDFEMMEPWFKMYLDALPLAQARTLIYFGHEGAFYPEGMAFWGAYSNEPYGYKREKKSPNYVENGYIRRYWQGAIELLAIMLDVYGVTEDRDFLASRLLPLARPILTFYSQHYPLRDDDGKILFKPAQSLETWHEAVNPLPEVAGLRWVLDGLLTLPSIEGKDRDMWVALRTLLPPLPKRTYFWEKRTELIDALQYDFSANFENPALYAVFPYRLFGIGKPNLEIGFATWESRRFKGTYCWNQNAIQAALLGLTEEAKQAVIAHFMAPLAGGARFPIFWGPHNDWIPDIDHGGVAMTALQRMLMQCDDGRIRLFPAWPKEWDVRFKLHAPQQTIVECVYNNGIIQYLSVTPESRRKDLELTADSNRE